MSVYLHTPESVHSRRHAPSWLLLAAAAGTVNGCVFIMCEQFVTHITGTVTRLGLEWPHAVIAAEYAAVIVCFVLGAVASVASIQAPARKGRPPRWATPLLAVSAILVGAAVAGQLGVFGPFGGTHAADPPPVTLLSLLAFAMGLQNAAVSTATKLSVRTTHLTGPASDFGVHLGVAWLTSGPERSEAVRAVLLRGGIIAAFTAGAGLSVTITGPCGYLTFLAPAAFVALAAVRSFMTNPSPSLTATSHRVLSEPLHVSAPHNGSTSCETVTCKPALHYMGGKLPADRVHVRPDQPVYRPVGPAGAVEL